MTLHLLHTNAQRGVVLVMALVVMGVIAVTSALAIRSVTLGDRVGRNIRAQDLAMHAAEVTLRWCETDVMGGGAIAAGTSNRQVNVIQDEASPGAPGGSNERWRVLANWSNPAWVARPPAQLLTITANGLSVLPYDNNRMPQCMAQLLKLTTPSTASSGDTAESFQSVNVLITVRGFSPDYVARTATTPGSGGEVWLQSRLIDYVF